MDLKLLVIGGGRMGSALVSGLIASNWCSPDQIGIVESSNARREELLESIPGLNIFEEPTRECVVGSEGVVLAVKPDDAEGVCRKLNSLGMKRLLSIVAGLSTPRLEASSGHETVVIRAMPNTAALVGEGMTAISGGSNANSIDLDWAQEVLSSVGTVVRLPERHLDAVTGLSGSGPAYVFLVVESLIEAGVLAGLSREVSHLLAVQTLVGSAALLHSTGMNPELLRAEVTSPGGTTAAGLRVLEAQAVRSAFIEAVMTASERSRNLQR